MFFTKESSTNLPDFPVRTDKHLDTIDINTDIVGQYIKPEDHWSCIAHLSAENVLKSAVIEETKFKHSPWAGTDNPLGPKF